MVLGNGISRLIFDDLIKSWPGEVWGCNRVFNEYGDILDRLTGHKEVLIEAAEYRDENQVSFELWGGQISNLAAADKEFTCSKEFCKDSGTTMIAQGLHEGRDIALCGFDLGGPDVISPGIENSNKQSWVRRLRKLLERYGRKRIRFIGYDHLPFLLSRKPPDSYAKCYRVGAPHIYDAEYLKVWEKWAGRPAYEAKKKGVEMKVKFKDGRIVDMKGPIALKMAAKGKVEILEEKKPAVKKPAPAKKAEK